MREARRVGIIGVGVIRLDKGGDSTIAGRRLEHGFETRWSPIAEAECA